MAMTEYVPDIRTRFDSYLGLMARAKETTEIIEVVQRYLANWPTERVANVQKIDAGWAPFDECQRPVQVDGTLDVHYIRDAIHCHCMALMQANVALTPEFLELDEFFLVASEVIEKLGRVRSPVRTPATPTRRDVLANW